MRLEEVHEELTLAFDKIYEPYQLAQELSAVCDYPFSVIRNFSIVFLLCIILVLPVLVSGMMNFDLIGAVQFVKQTIATLCLFLIPLVLFYKKIRLYFYFLIPLVLLTPLFIFSISFFLVEPGLPLIALTLQTNFREAKEAVGPLMIYFVPTLVAFVWLYMILIKKIRFAAIPFSLAVCISSISALVAFGIIYFERQLYYKSIRALRPADFLDTYHYPLSLISGANQAHKILMKNNLDQASDFKFFADRQKELTERQIYLLIIGESSAYHHWQINGYHRETSPRLASRNGVVTLPNMIAGAHYTWVSVPQLITRATPEDYDRQYREKSILTVFKEAGFKTVWLSNQSADEIFLDG